MLENDTLTIANLPRDIIRRIIREKGFAVKNMRLISMSWNSLVQEFISERKRFRPMHQCLFWTRKEEHDLLVNVAIEKQHWPAFSKRLAGINIPEVSVRTEETDQFYTLSIQIEDRRKCNKFVYEYIQKLLLLPSRIDSFVFYYLSDECIKQIEKLIPKLVAVRIARIVVDNFSQNLQNFFLKIAYNREFEEVFIIANEWSFDTWSIRDYLLQFPKLSSRIYLEQRGDKAQPRFLFGDSNERCEATAVELIVRGMKRVELYNPHDIFIHRSR